MSDSNTPDGGQMIVDYLVRNGVPYAFGLCGHGNIGFIDALYQRQDDIRTISVRHETVAGFMADVYYRVSGQPTATFTSCGPGSANMPIALGNAFLDSVPFFAVTGNVPTNQFNRGAFQELYRHHQADFPSTVRAYCKRVFQPTRGEQMAHTVREAWKTMVTGRPGPDFRIYTIRRGDRSFAMVYAGPASQFPIYSGEMIEAGGRASVVSTEDGVRHAREHLFQREGSTPREIHVWTMSLEGADRALAERIAQSVDVR